MTGESTYHTQRREKMLAAQRRRSRALITLWEAKANYYEKKGAFYRSLVAQRKGGTEAMRAFTDGSKQALDAAEISMVSAQKEFDVADSELPPEREQSREELIREQEQMVRAAEGFSW